MGKEYHLAAGDPLVADASRAFVGSQGNTVAADGFVARPGIDELKQGNQSGMARAIKYARS